MNQHLQTILNLIQQAEHLSVDEKTALSKAAKNADKELEITSFKLERTEKVKHTTAILLEETIEELENKRKAVEVQNRELEVEAALERVRAIAMSMSKPDDMLQVCHIISDQLELLNVKEIRNVQTAIFYESKGTYMNYEYYARHNKTIITETSFTNHKMHREFAAQMLKGKGEFFTTYMSKGELPNWIAYQKTTNVFIDTYLETASSLNYYWHSLGSVALGISTYEPLREEETNLFRRFLKVFELSYTRYLDIEQAIAQAREAQIQLALERVRARTMAMQKSDELSETAVQMFEQVQSFGVELWSCGFNIWEEGETGCTSFIARGGKMLEPVKLSFDENPFVGLFYESKQKEEEFWFREVSEEDSRSVFGYVARQRQVQSGNVSFLSGIVLPPQQIVYLVNFSHGNLMFIIPEPHPELHDIFKRFGKVFEQTYTRFLDLQKAEAQAREAQIEAALEKVRSRTMAMHKSEELIEVIASVFQQLEQLSFRIDSANLFLNYKENPFKFWTAVPGHLYPSEIDVPYGDFAIMNRFIREIKSNATLVTAKFNQEEKNEWVRHLIQHSVVGNASEEKKKLMFEAPGLAMSVAGVKNIALAITNYSVQSYSDEENEILRRFVIVFGQTYTRFLDLQKAEAQAREAQIEAALERVRSRTTGMQKSEELREVIQIVFEQLRRLDFNIDSAHFNLNYKETDDYNLWSAAPGQPYPVKTYIPYFNHPVFITARRAKEDGLDFFTESYTQDEKNKFFEHLFKHAPVIPGDRRKYILSSPGVAASTVLMNTISLWIMNYAGIPYTEAENAILKRFGKIFEQSHTRFLDLQKAEAQAREAKIEASLEKVRTVALSLKKSDDMLDIAQVLYEQLLELGFTNIRNAIIDIHNDKNETFLDYDYSHDMARTVTLMSYYDHPIIEKQVRQIQSGNDVFFEIVLEGKDLQDLIALRLKNGEMEDPRLRQIEQLTYNLYSFGNGAIGISNFGLLGDEQKIILKRFRNVFTFAYKRYTDLAQAEAQAREAQIEAALERVRSRSMGMQKSEELRDVIQVIFEQMVGLNINVDGAGFAIDFRESDDWNIWNADAYTPFPIKIHIPYFDHPVANAIIEAKNSGVELVPLKLTIEERNTLLDHVFKYAPASPEAKEVVYNTPGFAESDVLLKNVLLFIHNYAGIPYTDAENATLIRFGKVFEQTYTRFKDLEKAEAQAFEVVKRASVDRVRAEIASMRTTNDLERITPLIWNELTTLGVPFIRCGVFIMDEEKQLVETHLSTPDGEAIATFNLPYNAPGETAQILAHWYEKEMYKQHWNEAQFIEFTQNLLQQGAVTTGEKYLTEGHPTDLYLHFLPFLQGMLYAGNTAPLNDDELQSMQNLADAFSTAYARYEDFNKLEEAKGRIETTLSELKATQHQLIQSEKMASLGELTAGIAHEIQNPLNFVNNFSEVNSELISELVDEVDKGNMDEVKAIARDIKDNEEKITHHGKRADSIVKGMLLHSRVSTGQKEPTDINALCDEYLRLSYHGLRAKDKSFNADFKTDFDRGLSSVAAKINIVPQDIGRVLLNLYNNAFYAVKEKVTAHGSKLAAGYKPIVSVQTKKTGDKIGISVSDNGNGIPQNIIEKIFQPFFTTKPTGQGTGLGLSLSYDIIKAHGGEIKVETKEGEGSEFIIRLPI